MWLEPTAFRLLSPQMALKDKKDDEGHGPSTLGPGMRQRP